MSALENLIVAQHNRLMKASGFSVLGLLGLGGYRAAEREAVELAEFWLDRTGLTAKADWNAGALPYGDQRKLEIARAMCTEPRAAVPRRAGGRPQPARDRPSSSQLLHEHPRRAEHRRSC